MENTNQKENEILEAIKSQVADAKNGMASVEEVEGIKSQLSEISEKLGENKEVETLKSQIEEIGLSVKALEEKGKGSESNPTSFKSLLESKKEELKAVIKGEKQLTIKAPATMLISTNIVGAEADRLPVPEYMSGVMPLPSKRPFYVDFADVSGVGSATIIWTDEVAGEGDAEWTPENGVKPLMDCDYEPKVSNAKKVAVRKKVSEEMLDDIDFIAGEIERNLRKAHDLKLEDGLINGDSGVDPNSVDGVTKFAPAYIGGTSLSATIIEPNNFDVIIAGICQIQNSSDGAYTPDVVFVNPSDACAMDLAKTSDGAYVMPPFTGADGRVVSGVRVVPQTKIPSGYFLLGDFSHSHVRLYKDFTITFGWENDDFSRNLRTIIGESRVHHFISANEYSAFLYDQFSVVKADLLKV